MKVFKFICAILFSLGLFLSCAQAKKEKQQLVPKDVSIKKVLNTKELLFDNGTWTSLFNGENLNGWEVMSIKEDKKYNFWTVKNGAIEVNSMGTPDHDYMWLQTNKEYADFVLKLKFQSHRESPGNSGVQIRSRYDMQTVEKSGKGKGWLDGPQVDIHPSGSWRTGLIYDETRGHQRWIYPSLPNWEIKKETYAKKLVPHYFADEAPYWNDLVIICKGNRIKTIVNNIVVSNYDGTGILDDVWHKKYKIDKKGHIAFQLHRNNQLKIAFKDIVIKEL
ncbi:3-keto-disaccharide hydrolase [Lutibacter citreus]|uniref:3-keto-disaccharide hydrolase n=1 Tax=Lutibacter citreus TaxID=2138210 RepID=UPI000DBE32D5|nr:DUF1080 domain-containing protein [Lutibacter citreus]